MKSSLVLCLLLCVLLVNFRGNDAIRKDPASTTTTTEEYWKKVMKDEPLPKSIKELLVFEAAGDGDHAATAVVDGEKKVAINRFVKDFDTLTTAIIYHNTQSHGG
ncbi:unnamed protein product [Linum trigynum]|uniref:Uncharacterized protein n=1 Tax=Linum trigynum TaxID=586398 RepID=A0AAV2CC32_9ROSI